MSQTHLDATDLVEYFKLDSSISESDVVHTRFQSDPARRQRKVKVEDRWQRRTKFLGGGGFGEVWLEERTDPVPFSPNVRAVKEVVKQKMVDNGIDIRRELLALAKLSKHDVNFIVFYGWFENDTTTFLSMEYLPHGDLFTYMHIHERQTLKESEAISVLRQIAEGIDIMHGVGITHRDLKPQNIFVVQPDPDWWVKIGDFGISKRVNAAETALHTQIGTDSYMAPEIIDPDSDDEVSDTNFYIKYTTAVDIWSLGCVAFELLAPGSARVALNRFRRRRGPFPSTLLAAQGISSDGISFIQQLLELKPNRRPTSHKVLASPWLNSVSIEDSPSVSSLTLSKSAATLSLQDESNTAMKVTVVKSHGYGNVVAESEISTQSSTAAEELVDLNRWESSATDSSGFQKVKEYAGHSSDILAVAFSPDGQRIASGAEDNTLRIWDTESGSTLRTLTFSSYVRTVDFSPSGQLVVCGSSRDLTVVNAESGVIVQTLSGHKNQVNVTKFFADDFTVVSGSDDKTIRIWNITRGLEIKSFSVTSSYVRSLSISHDKSKIAAGCFSDTIEIWDIESGSVINKLTSGHSNAAVSFSPDDTRVIFASWSGMVGLIDVDAGTMLQKHKLPLKLGGWNMDPAIATALYSGDGSFIATAGGLKEVYLWDSELLEVRQKLTGQLKTASTVTISADSNMLLTGSRDKLLRLWKWKDWNSSRSLDS